MKKKVNRVKKKEEQKPKIEEQTSIIESQKPIIEEPITKDNGRWTADNLWLIGCLVIAAIAVFWRFYWLELKPFHHDEGVNGFFMSTLVRDGIYKYDPSNYHGPTLYYIALAFAKAFGFNTISMRASVAIFGVLTVVMAFFLKNYIGRIGSLTAALLLALSPGMVYISRYFIHEIFFVFCSFGIVLGVLFFIEKRSAGIFAVATMTALLLICFLPSALNLANLVGAENVALLWILRVGLFAVEAALVFLIMRMLLGWQEGRPIYLMLASASAVLFFATKETAFITIGTLILAVISAWLWRKIYRAIIGKPQANELEPVELTWQNFRAGLGDGTNLNLLIIAVSVVFAYIGVLFFSSFFTYSDGIFKAFEAYAIWTKTGTKDHTQSGTWGYLKWGMKVESPIFILSAIGTLIALIKARHRFAIFTGFWAFGLFAAYSIIPYKTPWLALSFLLPMCIVAGYGINELAKSSDIGQRIFAGLLAAFATVILGYQTYDLNFLRYDDDSMPYVYAHTRRGFLDMVNQIETYAAKSGKSKDAAIEVVSPDYWPLTWYMREYPKAIFHSRFADVNTSELIVASKAQLGELNKRYGANYKYVGTYPLRPGVELFLLVRKDLADANAQEISTLSAVAK
ncbi:MAG: glycosyltransferase family 39 protein [Acidobacteriota bacterium]|nr:glycosyltransferase family 39 protein [Acidobacteriota bacterium]